jgi:hypothetical protein
MKGWNNMLKFFKKLTKTGREELNREEAKKLNGQWKFMVDEREGKKAHNDFNPGESAILKSLEKPEFEQTRQILNQNWTHHS